MTIPYPIRGGARDPRAWAKELLEPGNAHVLDAMTARELAWQIVDLADTELASVDADAVCAANIGNAEPCRCTLRRGHPGLHQCVHTSGLPS